MNALQAQHGVDHEAGADEQDHSQGHFGNGEGVPRQPPGSIRGLSLAFPQDDVQIGTRRLDRGSQSKQDRSEQRNSQGKQQHTAIDADFGGVGEFSG